MKIRNVRRTLFAFTVLASPCALAQGIAPGDQPPPPSATQNAPTPPAAKAAGSVDQVDSQVFLGREVFSQDQTRIGKVEKVVASGDGQVQAIVLRTGGFLGFGGKLVSIPQGKFSMRGANVQLDLTSEEVQQLPAERDAS